jgi:hypothetical protein
MGLRRKLRGDSPEFELGNLAGWCAGLGEPGCRQSAQSGDGLWTDGRNDHTHVCLR